MKQEKTILQNNNIMLIKYKRPSVMNKQFPSDYNNFQSIHAVSDIFDNQQDA